jgi:hypothetical protein
VSDLRRRELERAARDGDPAAQAALRADLIRTGALKEYRIENGLLPSYPLIIAKVAPYRFRGGPGPWSDAWVVVDRWEGSIEDERQEFGEQDPEDDWKIPWLVGEGAGYQTIRYMVYNEGGWEGPGAALSGAETEWPETFSDWHQDYEGEPNDGGPEIRVIARCEEWQAARKLDLMTEIGPGMSVDTYELLDGRFVEAV